MMNQALQRLYSIRKDTTNVWYFPYEQQDVDHFLELFCEAPHHIEDSDGYP